MQKLTKEQVEQITIVNEWRAAIKSEVDYINLMGNKPSLKTIRVAYHTGEIGDVELDMVLNALYAKTGGEDEPYKNAKEFYKYMFADQEFDEKPAHKLSTADQVAIIKGMDIKQKNKKRSSTPKAKKQVTIDANMLPESLKYLLK